EKTPLSDRQLSQKFSERGIRCSRRTIAKYRQQLEIGPAHQRKIWKP
ncbi:MAG: RNA polymerase factor sigma-54, partial [Chlamydiota bacterium]